MTVNCVWEHNGNDTLLYASDLLGAYTRGKSLDVAAEKMEQEVLSYLRWSGEALPSSVRVQIIQEKASDLQICDADSDVLFDTERAKLSMEEYAKYKALALKSAVDFLTLYHSIPNRDAFSAPRRETFYGAVPRTANEMYEHTKRVNAYYFGEIGVDADNEGSIFECRLRGFETLQAQTDFLSNPVVEGSYGEEWSLRKLLRRFLWHDRIHAKAMWRMATELFGRELIADPFCFACDR